MSELRMQGDLVTTNLLSDGLMAIQNDSSSSFECYRGCCVINDPDLGLTKTTLPFIMPVEMPGHGTSNRRIDTLIFDWS